jgi:hypothetical protein
MASGMVFKPTPWGLYFIWGGRQESIRRYQWATPAAAHNLFIKAFFYHSWIGTATHCGAGYTPNTPVPILKG